MRLEPADAPFEDRPWYGMPIEIRSESCDLLRWSGLLVGRQEGEIGARRTDRMDAGKFSAEALGKCRERGIEERITSDSVSCGCPVDSPHDEKRLAEDGWVLGGEERFGHYDAGGEGRLQHREFLVSAEARGNPGRRRRAQHEPLIAGEQVAEKTCVDRPILLDGSAPQRREAADFDLRRPACRGEKAGERRAVVPLRASLP